MPDGPRVQGFRGEISAVRPNDSSELGIDLDLPEVRGIRERLDDTLPWPGREIDISFASVVEVQMEAMVAYQVERGDMNQIGHGCSCYASGGMARKVRDWGAHCQSAPESQNAF